MSRNTVSGESSCTPKVMLFALSTCGHCKAVRRLLAELAVPHDAVEVDLLNGSERADALALVKQFNPRCTFPTVVIGDAVVVGNREDEIKQALQKKA